MEKAMKRGKEVKLARGRFDAFCDKFEKDISSDAMRFMCECFQNLDNAWLAEYLKLRAEIAKIMGK